MDAQVGDKSNSNSNGTKMDRRAMLQQWLLEKKKKKEEELLKKQQQQQQSKLRTKITPAAKKSVSSSTRTKPVMAGKTTISKTTTVSKPESNPTSTSSKPVMTGKTTISKTTTVSKSTLNITSNKTTAKQPLSKTITKSVTKPTIKQPAPSNKTTTKPPLSKTITKPIAKVSVSKPTSKPEIVKSTNRPTLINRKTTVPKNNDIKSNGNNKLSVKNETMNNPTLKKEKEETIPKVETVQSTSILEEEKNEVVSKVETLPSASILEEEKNEIISSISNLSISDDFEKSIEEKSELESDKNGNCKEVITQSSNKEEILESVDEKDQMELVTTEKNNNISPQDETPQDTNNLLLFPFLKNSQGDSESMKESSSTKLMETPTKTPSSNNNNSQFTTPRFKFFNSMITPSKPNTNDVESFGETSEENMPSSIIVLEKMRAGKNKEILGSDYVVTPVRRSVRFLKGTPNETIMNTRKLLAESNWAYSPNVALKNVDLPSFKAPPSTSVKPSMNRWRKSLMCPQTDIKNNHRSKVSELLSESENKDNTDVTDIIKKEKKKHRNSECLEFRRVQYSSSYGSTYVIQTQPSDKSEEYLVTPVRRSRRILGESAKK